MGLSESDLRRNTAGTGTGPGAAAASCERTEAGPSPRSENSRYVIGPQDGERKE